MRLGVGERLGRSARAMEILTTWFQPDLTERFMDGFGKAGM